MTDVKNIKNYINGKWVDSNTTEYLDVTNPATGEVISRVPISTKEDVDAATEAASEAFEAWATLGAPRRAKILFKYQQLLVENKEELARLVTIENGKAFPEAMGEVGRGIENVEFAAGSPTLMMGDSISTIATDVEAANYRYPVGVVGGITPFNFPMMVPAWMFPMAISVGNTFILKPSEKTPQLAGKLAELFTEAGLPDGVFNIVHGAHDVVDGILDHPEIKAISFVGSEEVGRYIYTRGSNNLKRVQSLTGAKNHTIILEDANLESAANALIGSAFGSAGQRCMATSVLPVQESIYDEFMDILLKKAKEITIGDGLDEDTFLGPVIDAPHLEQTRNYIENGVKEGATLTLDGREGTVPEEGYFIGPTIFEDVTTDMDLWKDEIFAPVLSVIKVKDIHEAVSLTNESPFANGACLFTNNASAIRYFRENIDAGMLGINLAVPAPMAFFPFSGWKDSFYGTLPANGKDGMEFYTRKKVVTARYPKGDI